LSSEIEQICPSLPWATTHFCGEYRGAITKLLQDIRPSLDSSSSQSRLTSPQPILLVKIDNVVAVLQSLL